jgi:uncharacterized protein (DUF2384 family)
MRATITKPTPRTASPKVIGARLGRKGPSLKTATMGVVRSCVQGASGSSLVRRPTPTALVGMLQAGLPFSELAELQVSLALPMEKLAPLLGISKATLHRRKGDASLLSPAESDRVVRYARLLGQARQVLESLDARSEIGAREVEQLLGRIEHGVYS